MNGEQKEHFTSGAEPGAAAQHGGGREIRGTVAALRLDAVMALGFGLSRSRAVLLIKGGLQQVNGKLVESPSCRLNPGDSVAVEGRGRVELAAVTGQSRKGRVGVILKKFK